MPKPTASITFRTPAPYTLTRDVRLYDGTLVEGVKVVVEHVYKKGKATSPNREYSVEAFHYDIPNEGELEQEQLDELIAALDGFVISIGNRLSFGDEHVNNEHVTFTPNHVITRTSKVIRPDEKISL